MSVRLVEEDSTRLLNEKAKLLKSEAKVFVTVRPVLIFEYRYSEVESFPNV